MVRVFGEKVKLLIVVAVVLLGVCGSGQAGAAERIGLVPVKNIKVDGLFWGKKLAVYKAGTIPHSWQYMGWDLRALKHANGIKVQGDLNGTWGEANLYKFMETCGHSLGMFADAELEKRMDEIIVLIAGAQRPDGYVHAYITNSGKPAWDRDFLDGSHDGYVLGHMIEAAVEYYANTGKKAFLDIACRAARQAYEEFLGPKGVPGFCGHAELEMALVELYRVVPDKRFLDLAKAFVEWRGQGKVKPAGPTPRAYFQDEAPLRQQKSLDGHAVRAIFFATGVADLAVETGDCDYRLASNRFWDSVTLRRMYITGSIGPRKEHEAFGEDYELPNDGYCESCGACGLADFAQRMFMLEGRAECGDVLERVLYNAILHGISLNGTTSYYQNPLSDKDNPRYNSWVCCPPNLSRTLFQVGRYAYGYSEDDIYVNLYVGGRCVVPLKRGGVELTMKTDYPWDGRVKIGVKDASAGRFSVHLRMPGWCRKAELKLNGKAVEPIPVGEKGYIILDRVWHRDDSIELNMEMPVVRIEAHPNVKSCVGKVALQRGPIVYGFEGLDNDGDVDIELGADPQFGVEHKPDMLGGITIVRGQSATGKGFTAIPFYAFANRAKSRQEVWVVQRGVKPNDRWWLGELYRPVEKVD
ncbi:MAG: glycoside hydrolase family 127 protein [Sedimentisphaerales bacterium]|nr:glycoside hydrolase family 127 protein [Sedimentisphaerales bacterium]